MIPWGENSLLGTTDADFDGDPAQARVEQADIDYLLAEARALFPDAPLSESDIITTTVGVRSVAASVRATPSERSREHRVVRTGCNLLSIIGGKYTTHRVIAQQTVDAAYGLLNVAAPPCRTAEVPVPNRQPAASAEDNIRGSGGSTPATLSMPANRRWW